MRAVVCEAFGEPQGLKVQEVPEPTPGEGQVVVQVEAVGLGYVDGLLVRGAYQIKPPLPYVPGSEIAGRIIAVGPGISTQRIGERVLALGHSALSERVALAASACVPLPDGFSAQAAAGALVSYCTNIYAFESCAALRPGETILVLGAAGSVGSSAIDLAKGLGAFVVACASSREKLRAATARGADITVDYSHASWRKDLESALNGRSVNVVYDPVGGGHSETAFRCLAPGGRHLVIGFASGEIPRIPLNLPLLKRSAIVGVDWGGYARAHPDNNRPLLERLFTLYEEGKVHPEPTSVWPLEQAGEVLQSLLDRRSIGKPVIQVSRP